MNRPKGKISKQLCEAALDFVQVKIMPELSQEGSPHAGLVGV